jgi:hypothetical protein
MADMSKLPRHSMELAHESVMAEEQTIKPLTVANNKSLTLTRSVAAVLVVCALLFLGVIAVGGLVQTSKHGCSPSGSGWMSGGGCSSTELQQQQEWRLLQRQTSYCLATQSNVNCNNECGIGVSDTEYHPNIGVTEYRSTGTAKVLELDVLGHSMFIFCSWADKMFWTTCNLNNVCKQCCKDCINCATSTETPRMSWSPDDIRMCDCAGATTETSRSRNNRY